MFALALVVVVVVAVVVVVVVVSVVVVFFLVYDDELVFISIFLPLHSPFFPQWRLGRFKKKT